MTSAFDPAAVGQFRYVGFDLKPTEGRVALHCHYALDDLPFEEIITFETDPAGSDIESPEAQAAFRLVHLLAGISYYKAAAPPKISVGEPGLTPAQRRLLERFYYQGLGEYAYRNQLDLSGLVIDASRAEPVTAQVRTSGPVRPLIPFGGGLDSIVTVEGLRHAEIDGVAIDPALFVVSRQGDRFDAIETAIEVTGLPVCRAERSLDPKILRSGELGYRNGHIPVTGIISAIGITSAILAGRDAVVMSNEWSASSGNVRWGDLEVNHQWSKTLEFEDLFRDALAESMAKPPEYYSWLRCWSELWVAHRFQDLDHYHLRFRSCNRAFHIKREQRLDHWCGECDKCAFIDLILSPFLPRERLEGVFGDRIEPLANPDLLAQLRTLVGLSGDIKPFECVGDVDECRVAVVMAAQRDDRSGPESAQLQALAEEVRAILPGDVGPFTERLLAPLGDHRVPPAHAPADLLV